MEAAASDAPDKDQKAKISAKAGIARDQAGELQKMVDDKYGAKGELVKKALSSEKIAGQIASIKRATGLEDNPKKVASYKEKMAELQVKYKEDQAAIAELEPSEEDKKAEKEKKEKEAKDAKTAQDKLNADAEAAKKATADKEAADKETADKATADKATADKEAADKEKPKDDKNSKEGKLKRLEDMLAKAKESGDEEKIKKVQDLIDKVSAKESWQLDGTTLGIMLESEIAKLEMSFKLNESRYQNFNVKDRFSRLL
jgi:chromosome segregation ATPase